MKFINWIKSFFKTEPSPIYTVTEEIHKLLDQFEVDKAPPADRVQQLKELLTTQQAYLLHYGVAEEKIIEHTRYVYALIVRYGVQKAKR